MSTQTEPGTVYWKLIEPHWEALNDAWDADLDAFLSRLRSFPRKVQLLYAAHWCQSEVINGGFHQFFHNTTGLIAPEAEEGFRAVCLDGCAEALAEAMKYFGSPYPRSRTSRLALLPELMGKRADWDPFQAQDEQFYECIEAERDRWDRSADIFASA